MERRTPLRQGGKPLARTPLKPGTKGLNPGKGLVTRKPLTSTSTLTSKPRLRTAQPDAAPSRTAVPRKPQAQTGASAAVRRLAWERDGGRCVRCGAPGTNLQHREGRGAGGRGKADRERTNGVEWLVLLCGNGNASGCHRETDLDRTRAVDDGYVIPRNGLVRNAAQVPVRTLRGVERFTADGRREVLSRHAG